jgi:hypothetical protein
MPVRVMKAGAVEFLTKPFVSRTCSTRFVMRSSVIAPHGWVPTFDDVLVDGAIALSSWFEVGYHEKGEVTVTAPFQWALTAYACDFRSPETIAAERVRRGEEEPWSAPHHFLGEVWVKRRG